MAVEYKDYYKILGIPKGADEKTVKSAYRRLARKHHPDVAKTKDAGERFKEISEAYEVLSDPEKRQRYDRLGRDWQRYAQGPSAGPGGGFRVEYGGDLGDLGGFSDFFRSIFGDLGARTTHGGRVRDLGFEDLGGVGMGGGRDVQADVEISLAEAYAGTRKTLALDLDAACSACGGTGRTQGRPCEPCAGQGAIRSRRQVDVKIPAGVRSGQRVRVRGQGAGPAGAPGDLYLSVTVSPHPIFERRGDDIHVTLPLSVPEAALGTSLEVPTLRGRVTMKVPSGTSSGLTFRLRGYGMPRPRGSGVGDQLVSVTIVVPTDLTGEEKDLYQKLAALRPDTPRAR